MVTISLCMIVKDEEAVLGRCLDSVKDLVEEMIIVDTGSSDRTKEIAAQYTDQIYDFIWIDDFSAARNEAFSKAKMDYCMWLDADDVLPKEAGEKLLAWKTQTDGSTDAVLMPYATGFDEEGKVSFCYERERLLKNKRGFRWEGRVHEAIAVFGKVEKLDVCIEHRSQKTVYGKRNLRIYEKMKEAGEPFGARDLFYYGRELYYHKRYEEAIGCFLFFLKREDAFCENQVDACRYAAYALYQLGREEEALDFLYQGLRYRTPGGELCCDLGKHFLDRKKWEQAVFWYQAALHAKREEGGFVQAECYGYVPYLQLCVCYDRMGEEKKAYQCHKMAGKYKPYGREYLKNEEYFRNMEEERLGKVCIL